MTPHFSPGVRRILLQMPTYTPSLLATGDDLALVIRVEKLAPFRKPLPLMVRVVTWQHGGGAWLVTVAFRVTDNPKDPMEGDAYLNPRQAEDWANIERLSKQTRFPFIFCNPSLTEAVGKAVPWTAQQQGEISELIRTINSDLVGRLGGDYDPDFQVAKDEFQRLYGVKELLERKEPYET